jgi:signal transduction histidine kinase
VSPSQLLLDSDSEEQSEVVEKIFNVKSMQVEWQGRPSFMHVFIDNTDIVRLEEATNNIKCQKIMFASVSHEFRTPLNAIMNSYNFIEDSFKKLQDKICPDSNPQLTSPNKQK